VKTKAFALVQRDLKRIFIFSVGECDNFKDKKTFAKINSKMAPISL
jgi:hypothetical protein